MATLYVGGRVFDGEKAQDGHAVLEEGGKVKRVAPAGEFAGFAGEKVDTSGGTLIPGIIDCNRGDIALTHHHLNSLARFVENQAQGAAFDEGQDFAATRQGKDANVVGAPAGRSKFEAQFQVRNAERRADPLRPFDQAGRLRTEVIAETRALPFRGVFQPKKIKVIQV